MKAERIFTKYLQAKGLNEQFWLYDEYELDKVLCKFWFEVHTTDGDYYKIGSLENLQYALSRCLQEHGHEFDLVDSESFRKSQKCFKDACIELKQKGYGVRQPYKS